MKLFVLLLLSSFALGQLPNPKLTPGVARTGDKAEICAKNFRTKNYRHTSYRMKKFVCNLYHASPCPRYNVIEIDHLIPLELGGADVDSNLWVEYARYSDGPGYHVKDRLEKRLRSRVCRGQISLINAQRCIAYNWIECYKKTFHVAP